MNEELNSTGAFFLEPNATDYNVAHYNPDTTATYIILIVIIKT